MHKKPSEEQIIVHQTMELLNQDSDLSPKKLRILLQAHANQLSLTKEFGKMSDKTFTHYIAIARMFITLNSLLDRKSQGTELLSAEDYQALLSTGTKLSNVADRINRLSEPQFLSILKLIATILPCSRDDIDRIVRVKLQTLTNGDLKSGRTDEHNKVRDTVATKYLYDIGCHFVTTEAKLEKGDRSARGLKIDAYGWKADGTTNWHRSKIDHNRLWPSKISLSLRTVCTLLQ